jgi:hypothetical protein
MEAVITVKPWEIFTRMHWVTFKRQNYLTKLLLHNVRTSWTIWSSYRSHETYKSNDENVLRVFHPSEDEIHSRGSFVPSKISKSDMCHANYKKSKTITGDVFIVSNNLCLKLQNKLWQYFLRLITCSQQWWFSSLLRYYAVSTGRYLHTFRSCVMPPNFRVFDRLTQMKEAMRPPEPLVTSYHVTRYNIAGDLDLRNICYCKTVWYISVYVWH